MSDVKYCEHGYLQEECDLAKLAEAEAENGRLREALGLLFFQEQMRGYPTATEWMVLVGTVRSALEKK